MRAIRRIGFAIYLKCSGRVLCSKLCRGRNLDLSSGRVGLPVAAQPAREDIARFIRLRQFKRAAADRHSTYFRICISAILFIAAVVLQHYADLPVALPHSVEVRLKLVVILKAIRRTARRRIVDRRGILRLRPAEQSLIAVREGIHVRAEVEVVGLRGRNECVLIISRHTAIAVQRQDTLPHLIGDVGSIIIGVVRDRHCALLILAAAD